MTIKKCTKKCAARAKLLFRLVNLFLCWRFCRRRKFWMTVERRDEKSSGASCSKDGECCPLEKSPSSLWCNYFPQLLTLHLNWELLSFWKYRDLEDPLDPKDLEDHVVNRYCKPIHYLWYIFLSPAAWLDAEGGGNVRSFLSCSKPSFSFFEGVARRSGTLRIIPPLYFRCLRSISIWW